MLKPRKLAEHWKILLFAAVLVPVLCMLGFWQLERGQQKAEMLKELQAASAAAPRPYDLAEDAGDPARFSKLAISGSFSQQTQLLYDSQIWKGRFGYRVFAPVCAIEGSHCVLVERGWIEGSQDRSVLPDQASLAAPAGRVTVTGHVDTLQAAPLIEDNAEITSASSPWPRRVQMMEGPERLLRGFESQAELPHQTVVPWVLRLVGESTGALQPFWTPSYMLPAKHTGYAVQWFCMALALAGLTIWQVVRNDSEQKGTVEDEDIHA